MKRMTHLFLAFILSGLGVYHLPLFIQKIQESYPTAKIIVMGDLNDNPTNSSLKEVLHTKRKKSKTKIKNNKFIFIKNE